MRFQVEQEVAEFPAAVAVEVSVDLYLMADSGQDPCLFQRRILKLICQGYIICRIVHLLPILLSLWSIEGNPLVSVFLAAGAVVLAACGSKPETEEEREKERVLKGEFPLNFTLEQKLSAISSVGVKLFNEKFGTEITAPELKEAEGEEFLAVLQDKQRARKYPEAQLANIGDISEVPYRTSADNKTIYINRSSTLWDDLDERKKNIERLYFVLSECLSLVTPLRVVDNPYELPVYVPIPTIDMHAGFSMFGWSQYIDGTQRRSFTGFQVGVKVLAAAKIFEEHGLKIPRLYERDLKTALIVDTIRTGFYLSLKDLIDGAKKGDPREFWKFLIGKKDLLKQIYGLSVESDFAESDPEFWATGIFMIPSSYYNLDPVYEYTKELKFLQDLLPKLPPTPLPPVVPSMDLQNSTPLPPNIPNYLPTGELLENPSAKLSEYQITAEQQRSNTRSAVFRGVIANFLGACLDEMAEGFHEVEASRGKNQVVFQS